MSTECIAPANLGRQVGQDSSPVELAQFGVGFHLSMALGVATLAVLAFFGCRAWSIDADLGGTAIRIAETIGIFLPVLGYLYWRRWYAMIESALVILWAIFLEALIPLPVLMAARGRMPLGDAVLARMDAAMGVDVSAITAWASLHWLGSVFNASYAALVGLIFLAVLVPPLFGQTGQAKRFLIANLSACAVAVPVVALFPAVGPWTHYGFVPNAAQRLCESQIQALRGPGTYVLGSGGAGIICFPSFHVLWAVLCAYAFWRFRWLRVPVAALSVSIVISTVTTGWHYAADVIGGLALAAVSIAAAEFLMRRRWPLRLPVGVASQVGTRLIPEEPPLTVKCFSNKFRSREKDHWV